MPSVLLDKCCFCVPLRVGSLIIGYLLTIVEAILVCLACLTLATFVKFVENEEPLSSQLRFILAAQIGIIILYAIEMTSSIVLVVGLHIRRRNLIKIFFIIHSILLTLDVIYAIVQLALYSKHYRGKDWLIPLPYLVTMLIQSYSIFIVIRYYLEMNKTPDPNLGVVYTAAKSDEV